MGFFGSTFSTLPCFPMQWRYMASGFTLAPTQPGFHVSQAEPKMCNQQSCRPLIGQGATAQDDSQQRLLHGSQTRHFKKKTNLATATVCFYWPWSRRGKSQADQGCATSLTLFSSLNDVTRLRIDPCTLWAIQPRQGSFIPLQKDNSKCSHTKTGGNEKRRNQGHRFTVKIEANRC